MNRGAVISPCGTYRYSLVRSWDDTRSALVFLMLNPSIADGNVDDPTIRKCMGFAKRLGYGGIVVLNLFAYRATKPADLFAAGETVAIGPENDRVIRAFCDPWRPIVCAWGSNAKMGSPRVREVLHLLRVDRYVDDMGCSIRALAINKDGTPAHPLYLSYEVAGTLRRLLPFPN